MGELILNYFDGSVIGQMVKTPFYNVLEIWIGDKVLEIDCVLEDNSKVRYFIMSENIVEWEIKGGVKVHYEQKA